MHVRVAAHDIQRGVPRETPAGEMTLREWEGSTEAEEATEVTAGLWAPGTGQGPWAASAMGQLRRPLLPQTLQCVTAGTEALLTSEHMTGGPCCGRQLLQELLPYLEASSAVCVSGGHVRLGFASGPLHTAWARQPLIFPAHRPVPLRGHRLSKAPS